MTENLLVIENMNLFRLTLNYFRLSEIVFALKEVKLAVKLKITCDGISKQEYDKYLLAGSYFKNQEYDRLLFYQMSELD